MRRLIPLRNQIQKGRWRPSRGYSFPTINWISNSRLPRWWYSGISSDRRKRLGHHIIDNNVGSINNFRIRTTNLWLLRTWIHGDRPFTRHPRRSWWWTIISPNHFGRITIHSISRQTLFRHLPLSELGGRSCPLPMTTTYFFFVQPTPLHKSLFPICWNKEC